MSEKEMTMHTRVLVATGLALSLAAFTATAQTKVDKSFTTTSSDCSGVQWTREARQQYPTIATACQGVEMRDGKSYVKFQGKVERNINRGEQLAIQFKDGGIVTVAPPANTVLYVDGRKTSMRDLTRGTELTFYVPQDRLAAQFTDHEEHYVMAPFVRVVEPEQQVAQALPETASQTPWLAFGGAMLLAIGAGLTLRRRRHH
jgi:LPXTG-motif cell wall-anchored protein